jgi:hypothetical protein
MYNILKLLKSHIFFRTFQAVSSAWVKATLTAIMYVMVKLIVRMVPMNLTAVSVLFQVFWGVALI